MSGSLIIGGQTIPPDIALERFEANTYRTDHCWFWIGYTANGYGRTEFSELHVYAHVLAFVLFCGKVPEGKEICHTCDIRQCVRPDHLFAGTRLQNVQDAVHKGLNSPPPRTIGLDQHLATLTFDDVKTIRAMMARGASQREISSLFGCSKSTAWRIGKGFVRRTE